MNIRDKALRFFGRQQKDIPAGPYKRSAIDPGIILADDFAAATMIRQDGVRMVKISQQSFESTPLLQKIERGEFFFELRQMFTDILKKGSHTVRPKYSVEEMTALDAVIHDHMTINKMLEDMNMKSWFDIPAIHTAFNGHTAMSSRAGLWHTDEVDVLSVCLDGTGTEYLEGVVTATDRRMVNLAEKLPARIKVCPTGPGDLLVLHGREVYNNGDKSVDDAFAQYHRAGSKEGRRTVLLYPIGMR